MSLLETAQAFHDLGIPVFPVELITDPDPSVKKKVKKPRCRWKDQIDYPDPSGWAERRNPIVIGLPTGTASGLSVIDLDPEGSDDGPIALLPEGVEKSPLYLTTDRGGVHHYFKHVEGVTNRGSGKLESSSSIDIRGEGGFVVVYEPERLLEWILSGLELPVFPLDIVPPVEVQPYKKDDTEDSGRPGDWFNSNKTWDDILVPHGWVFKFKRGEVSYWQRPNHSCRDAISATTNYKGSNCLYNFSGNGKPFEAEKAYTLFSAHVLLNHGGDFSAAAKQVAEENGLDSPRDEEESDVYNPSRMDQLILFVTKHHRQTPSFAEIKAGLKMSSSYLSKLIKKDDEEGKNSTFRLLKQGKQKFLTLRKGTGLIRSDRVDLDVLNETRATCWLPANFHEWIGTDLQGLKSKTFLMFVAETDFGKTEFLINAAVENINRGLNVAYVQHEDDPNGFWFRVARRYLGRRPSSNEEAHEILQEKGVYERLSFFSCEDRAHIDEFLEDLADLKPELLIYDYMDQEYLETDETRGGSVIHSIIHSFGKHLISKEIPIITAAQVKRLTGGKVAEINSNWMLRANVVLQAVKKPIWDDEAGEVITDLLVRKNKQGGRAGVSKLKMITCPHSFKVLSVEKCVEKVAESGE